MDGRTEETARAKAWARAGGDGRQPGGAWYRGDLHVHTVYSDGDSGVAEVLAAAASKGLDFLAITDHDSWMEGRPRHWEDPAFGSGGLLLLYGMEWTTVRGHANIWSSRPFAHDGLWEANRGFDARAAAELAHARGALFSVNHPWSRDCSWRLDVPAAADAVEVWNAPFRFPNKSHRSVGQFYRALLLQGLRPTAVGGSDSHALKGFYSRFNPPGSPTTWVCAPERSAEGIIAGIKAGRVSVSYSSDASRLDLSADADGDGAFELMPGDCLAAGRPVTLKVEIRAPLPRGEGASGRRAGRCLLYRNDRVVRSAVLRETGGAILFRDTPEAGTFYRAELRGRPRVGLLERMTYGRMLALTNPIFVVPSA